MWEHLYANAVCFDEPKILQSAVVRGFGRGAKELGCPTANLDIETLKGSQEVPGIYYGLAQIEGNRNIFKCVVSVGWNPFYKNEKIAIEGK
jgi:FAD synthase